MSSRRSSSMTTAPTQTSGRWFIQPMTHGEQPRLEAGGFEEVLGDPLPRQTRRRRSSRSRWRGPSRRGHRATPLRRRPTACLFVDPEHGDDRETGAAGQYLQVRDARRRQVRRRARRRARRRRRRCSHSAIWVASGGCASRSSMSSAPRAAVQHTSGGDGHGRDRGYVGFGGGTHRRDGHDDRGVAHSAA